MPRNNINVYLVEDILIDAGIRSSAKRVQLGLLLAYILGTIASI